MSEENKVLKSVKTEILIAWIFAILVFIGWVIALIYSVVILLIVDGIIALYSPLVAIGIVYSIVFLILMIPSILVMLRVGRMYKAAKKEDVDSLKSLNSIGWAIVALIFSGIIPGVMLLVAHGPIEELSSSATSNENLDKVLKLKALLDSGVISREDFELQKDKLLHGISSSDPIETKLRNLKSLLDSGSINQEEYEEQKKRILSEL
jgi:hypothetical protein